MKYKPLCIATVFLLSLLALPNYTGPAYAQQRGGEFLAGVPANFPPHYSIDSKTGKPMGFAIDVMDEVAQRSGIKVRYAVYPTWAKTLKAMEKGTVVMIPNLGISAERETHMDFTSSVETAPIVIFVRDTTTDIKSIEDLKGKEVAVVEQNIGQSLMQKRGGSKLAIYVSQEEAFLSLLSGESDALVFAEPPITFFSQKAGLEDRIKIVGKPLLEVKRGIAVRKGNQALLKKLDDEVKTFVKTPRYAELYAKWYGKPAAYWTAKRVAVFGGGFLAFAIAVLVLWRYLSLLGLNRELKTAAEERKKADDALQKHEERFSAIVSNTPDHILMQDGELRYTFVVNPQLGLTEQDMLGKTDYDFLPKEEADNLTKVKRRILETGEPVHFETSLISREGTPEFFDGTYVPQYGAQGRISGLIGYFRNITERKKAEEELRISNEELQSLNRIITTTTTTTTGVKEILEKALDEALNITGLEGGTICMVTPDNALHLAAHRATSEATIQDLTTNAVKIGECLCGECARDHKPLILRDREAVLKFATREATRGEDIRFHAAYPLIIGEKCLGVLCVFTRTDRKPIERSLKLLETITSQIAIAVQNAQMYEEIRRHSEILENQVKERTIALQDSQKALTSLVEDLNQKTTELQAANKRLKEIDQLKSMFIASMSHELRTPLNSVIGFSSILLNEWAGPLNDEQKENLATVLRSGKHLLSLINDVIDVSKIEAGTIDVYAEDFDLHGLIAEVATHFTKDASDKGLDLIVENMHQPMHADRRRLLQSVMNLVSNAVKFTERGSVRVSVRKVRSSELGGRRNT